jgi:ABC-type uncharacterized transport system substrate-binding protein
MAFAPDLGERAERMASDVHQIPNGARPGEIPRRGPSRFRLIINRKAAKTVGVEIPGCTGRLRGSDRMRRRCACEGALWGMPRQDGSRVLRKQHPNTSK